LAIVGHGRLSLAVFVAATTPDPHRSAIEDMPPSVKEIVGRVPIMLISKRRYLTAMMQTEIAKGLVATPAGDVGIYCLEVNPVFASKGATIIPAACRVRSRLPKGAPG